MPLFPPIIGWQFATFVDISVKALHWLTKRITFNYNGNLSYLNRCHCFLFYFGEKWIFKRVINIFSLFMNMLRKAGAASSMCKNSFRISPSLYSLSLTLLKVCYYIIYSLRKKIVLWQFRIIALICKNYI